MKVLVIGSGGREHALVWKISGSPKVESIYCAPGNAGTAGLAENVDIAADDIERLADFAAKEGIDLTVVGPEVALTLGITDLFEKRNLRIFGPSGSAAALEGSKSFSKEIMDRYKIPTAAYEMFDSRDAALDYVEKTGAPVVIKADGLAAGKGVTVALTTKDARKAVDDIMGKKLFGSAGNRVVIEEFMEGEEASFLVFTDGKNIVPLPSAQDHKAVSDGDKGPNTGGMGAYSPAPVVTPEMEKTIIESIIAPTLAGMADEGKPYKGILYAGLMITDHGPKVVEFNCRFGDPECQPILMRMKSDIVDLIEATIDESLESFDIEWDERASVCVVMAAEGYPGAYEKGKVIKGLDWLKDLDDIIVFHAGTKMDGDDTVTSGGRVVGVTALGVGIEESIKKAYSAVEKISWDGVFFRTDIGKKALGRI